MTSGRFNLNKGKNPSKGQQVDYVLDGAIQLASLVAKTGFIDRVDKAQSGMGTGQLNVVHK
jgi:hypothetical protein